jgi:hypothetical protein
MAHFAELDENNVVLRVIVLDNKDTADEKGVEKEEIGIAFCKSLFGENTKWVQASYNANIRSIFPAMEDVYDEVNDVFVPGERGKTEQINKDDFIDAEVVEPTKAIE